MPARNNNRRRAAPVRSALALTALVLAMLPYGRATADCFANATGEDEAFTRQLTRDAHGTISALLAEIASAGGSVREPSVAHLYARLMDAYERIHEYDKARDAGAHGLQALTLRDSDALRRRLALFRIDMLEEQGRIRQAADEYDAESANAPEDAPDFACVLADRGYLHMRTGREADAVRELLRAYRLADRAHNDLVRAEAAADLAQVYLKFNLDDEALELENETIRALAGSSDTDQVATAHLIRGNALIHLRDLDAGIADYRFARQAYLEEQNVGDAVYTLERMCEALATDPARSAVAEDQCRAAIAEAQQAGDFEILKRSRGSLGTVELAAGKPRDAVALLSAALDDPRAELTEWQKYRFVDARARAYVALGDTIRALHDMTGFNDWVKADVNAKKPIQIAIIRAKYDFEAKDLELRQAQAEAAAARTVAAREALIRNFVISIAVATLVIGVVGLWALRRRRELIREREVVQDRVAALGRLAGGIAHEFNNALTVVQQATGLLAGRSSISADPDAVKLVRSIDQVARTSAATTAQLQSFGRQQHLQPRAISLGRYLEDIRPQLLMAGGSGLGIELQVGEPAPCAWVDERQLTTALLNLVVNARDAMASKGIVTIRAMMDPDRYVRIDVIDAGKGMSPEVLIHAAEPFFTTKPIGEGAGLGLSMVDGFVRQSGGTMHITSTEQDGTTVSLRLPPAPTGI